MAKTEKSYSLQIMKAQSQWWFNLLERCYCFVCW